MEIRSVYVLVLGAGWTSTFLLPLLDAEGVSYAATTTTGRDDTIKWKFDPDSNDEAAYGVLPDAESILVTFPLKGVGQSKHLLDMYSKTHPGASPRYLQLGSSGIYTVPGQPLWMTRHCKYNGEDQRAVAEDELRNLGGCVMNLSGLWGGERQPRSWVLRVAPTKDKLKEKKSLHLIHGQDVARAVLGVFRNFTPGERWLVTDGFVYDWWALVSGWGNGGTDRDGNAVGPHLQWVRDLMLEEGVKALPRAMEQLGRCYDSREFWEHVKLAPVRARA